MALFKRKKRLSPDQSVELWYVLYVTSLGKPIWLARTLLKEGSAREIGIENRVWPSSSSLVEGDTAVLAMLQYDDKEVHKLFSKKEFITTYGEIPELPKEEFFKSVRETLTQNIEMLKELSDSISKLI